MRTATIINAGVSQAAGNLNYWSVNIGGDATTTGTFARFYIYDNAGAYIGYTVGYTFSKNTWYHIAISRNNLGVLSIYVNGQKQTNVLSNQFTTSTTISNRTQYPLRIGNTQFTNYEARFPGTIDEVRIQTGTWLDGDTVSVPSAAYPTLIPAGTTSLLLHMDTSGFVDSSSNAVALLTNDGVTQDTTNKKFGASAALFNAQTDVLKYQNSSLFTFGTDPFTVEMWIRITGDTAVNINGFRHAFLMLPGALLGSDLSHWRLALLGSATTTGTGLLFNTYNAAGTPAGVSVSYAFAKNTWYHIAISRDSTGKTGIFINGSQVATTNALSGVNIENRVQYPVRVGGYEGAPINYPNNFLGQIDEVRVAKGTWKPEAGFALPISQYQ